MNIWRIETCKAVSGYRSTASIYNNIRDGLWTRPVKIGSRSVGWPSHEIIAINAARIAGASEDGIRELVIRLHAKRKVAQQEIEKKESVSNNGRIANSYEEIVGPA